MAHLHFPGLSLGKFLAVLQQELEDGVGVSKVKCGVVLDLEDLGRGAIDIILKVRQKGTTISQLYFHA